MTYINKTVYEEMDEKDRMLNPIAAISILTAA
jgi:hypothetical protein